MVESGLLTAEDFRDFTFSNPVGLFAGMNQDFFKGTIVEDEVRREIKALRAKETA